MLVMLLDMHVGQSNVISAVPRLT